MPNVYSITDRKKGLSATLWIIIANVIMFFLVNILIYINQDFIKYFALQPDAIMKGQYLWTLITSIFTHVEFWHIFVNMVSLAFLGAFTEKLIGRKRYFWLYMAAGIIANIFFILLSAFFGNTAVGQAFFGTPDLFAVGASGAIFGIAGLLTILIPKMKVLVFFVIPMRMWMAMVFFLVFFWFLSAYAGLPIGNSAHFGGFVTGLMYGIYL
jgi:membrane associated rhomboid family serine protease